MFDILTGKECRVIYYFLNMDTSKFATKADLKVETKSIRREILRVEEKVENLEEGQKRIEDMLGKMAKTLDGFVGRVDDLSVDNEVGTHHTRELELKIAALEKRVKRIESSKATA